MGLLTWVFGEDASILGDRSLQVLLLVNLSPPLGASLVSPLLESLTGPFGVSEAEVALMLTAFTAPSIVLIPIAGLLADRYGRKVVMVVGLLLFSLGGLAITLTTDFRVVLALRLVQGVGFAGLTPVIVTSLGDLYRGSAEATAQGIRFATTGLVLMTLPLVGGALLALAWQYPFYLYGIGLPAAAVVALFFEEPSDAAEDAETEGGSVRDVLSVVRQPRVAAVLVGRAVPNFLYIAFLTTNSFVVVNLLDGTPSLAGLLVTAASVMHVIAATQAGRVTAWFDSRLYPLLVATLSMGLGLAVVGLAPTYLAAVGGSAAIGLGFGLSLSLYRSVITGFTSDALRGSVVSVGSSLGRVGATVAPIVTGVTIAAVEPSLGSEVATRAVVVGCGVASAGVGTLTLVVARLAGPVVLPGEQAKTA